jgi:ABC-type transport system involved in Fe-S cluster assembly fused permease/ATPase subunit
LKRSRYEATGSWSPLTNIQHFNNEAYEIKQYDKHLKEYAKSSIKITTSLAFLNSGQAVIFSSALTGAMFMAAQGVVNGPFIDLLLRDMLKVG